MSAARRLVLFGLAAAATFGLSFAAGAAIDPVGLSDAEPAEEHDPQAPAEHGGFHLVEAAGR